MTGPRSFGTAIKSNTCVVEIGEWDLTIPGTKKYSYSRGSPEPDTKRYAAGVNFGYAKHGSRYNTSYVLDASEPQFRTSAILAALLTALEKIGEITKKYSSIRDIKIRTDSSALVDALAWGESFEEAYQDVI